MSDASRHDAWQAADRYDAYMGRWSRLIAARFLDWLALPAGLDWLELGSGTGALSEAILERCAPNSLLGIEVSGDFVATARERVTSERAEFRVGNAMDLPAADGSRDVVASALCLNFVPDMQRALGEAYRVLRAPGTFAFYVWDYPAGGLGLLHAFWTAAKKLDPDAHALAEDARFPFCTPQVLTARTRNAGFSSPECTAIEISTRFASFDDYWTPFTLGAGPAPGYCTSLTPEARERLKETLRADVRSESDGSVSFMARAWAIRATR